MCTDVKISEQKLALAMLADMQECWSHRAAGATNKLCDHDGCTHSKSGIIFIRNQRKLNSQKAVC